MVHSRNLTEIPRIAIFDESYLFQGPSFWSAAYIFFDRIFVGKSKASKEQILFLENSARKQFCSWRFWFDVCGVLQTKLGGGVKGFIFSPLAGEMIQFD